ncbi:MAG: dTDP-glucose 4,6-dehydratase [Eubacteriales bacterium]
MKILVTGGAGFIGSNFIYYLLDKYKDYKIVCLDLLTYAGNLKTLEGALKNKNFSFFKGDITDQDFVFRLFSNEGFDIVVNFASESHVDRSIKDPGIFLKTNILGTQILMDASRAYYVKRFHQISTDEVYGDLPLDNPDLFFSENDPLMPSSPYSASKAAADLLVLSYYKTFHLSTSISRCSNNYGRYQFLEKLIPLMLSKALKNEFLPIYGKGENIRDWVHVDDHCSAIDLIIHKGKVGEVYNVGSYHERTNIEVVKMILKELNKPETLIQFVPDRPGHDKRYAVDSSKIQKELGWQPETMFDDGIKRTIQWYLNHKAWWENIINVQ